jgi:hypothetical protein
MLLLPVVAGGEPPGGDPVGALRAVERASGQVAQTSATLHATAARVAAGGRLTALARLADQQADLEHALVRLQRAIDVAKAALPEVESER